MNEQNQNGGTGETAPLQLIRFQADTPLVRLAAEELQRYVRQLFGFTPPMARADCGGNPSDTSDLMASQTAILLGAESSERLPDQGYVIRPAEWRGRPALSLMGGSPRAILWAAYEVVAAWGVHFLVQGDVFPEDAGPFHLPQLDCRRKPVFPRREFRVLNDMASSAKMAKWVEAAGSEARAVEILNFLMENHIVTLDEDGIYHWYRSVHSGGEGEPWIHECRVCDLEEHVV